MNALIISALLGVVMMFTGIFTKNKGTVKTVALLGIIGLAVVNVMEMQGIKIFGFDASAFMSFTQYGLLFYLIAIASTLFFFLVSANETEKVGNYFADYYALIFFIISGIGLILSFKSLLILFLGIEIISIPLYVLTGAGKNSLKSNEASLKYLLMGAFSTGIFLMGVALIYGAFGSFSIDKILITTETIKSNLVIAGILLMLFSMAFKASVAPFHFWTPDVYDGAPTVFTSFMATVVKVAFFYAFIKLFQGVFAGLAPVWQFWCVVLIATTLFIGNITAVFQQSVKRLLTYSSVSQAAFLMIAVLVINDAAREGFILYSAAYCIATIGVFVSVAKINDYSIEGYNGLAKTQPFLAFVTTVFLLSLAGIPLTAGFMGKFYMLKALIVTGKYLWLVIFAVLMAVVSVYYYFKIIQAMYFKEGNAQITNNLTLTEKIALVAMVVIIIILGVAPAHLFYWMYF